MTTPTFPKNISFAVLGFCLGVLIATTFHKQNNDRPTSEMRLMDSSYLYINPLIDFQNIPNVIPDTIRKTESLTTDYIDSAVKAGDILYASVFFRDLANGPQFSINHDQTYTPASLLKIPILLSYLKRAEYDLGLLEQTIRYETEIDTPIFPQRVEQRTITPGTSYPIKQLLEQMITESDNEATILLLANAPQEHIDSVYKDLSVPFQPLGNVYEPFITASQYASFLRILYNGTYLTKDYSEYALTLLTQSSYRNGLRKYMPPEIPIASKFGVYETNIGTHLHECGIVYTNRPYILCIMTKGTELVAQEKVLSDISKIIYDNVAAR